MSQVFSYLSLGFSLAATVPYVLSIIRNQAKPEKISWFIWTVLSLTYFWSAIRDDGAVLFTAGELIGPLIIFLLALKYGVGGKSKFDQFSLFVAVVALVLLFFIEATIPSLLLAIFIDIIGVILTVKKLLIDRSSEPRMAWILAILSSGFALLSLENFKVESIIFPLYVLIVSILISLLSSGKPKTNHREIKEL